MDPSLSQAVVDNIEWCDLVCRSLELGTGRSDVLWWCVDEAPPLYPDVITARPDVPLDALFELIEQRPTCTVKDSFGALDLTGEGFSVLFDASWIVRAPGVPDGVDPAWDVLVSDDDLDEWERAWIAAGGATNSLRPGCLRGAPVSFLAERDGGIIVAGVAVHHGAGVMGMSNLFRLEDASDVGEHAPADEARAWVFAASAVSWLAPELGVVGYERGAALTSLIAVGFERAGDLRVWQRSGDEG